MKTFDLLINFTGGIDSTYALYTFLKDNPDKKVLVHHCNLINYQKRYDLEKEAIKNILEYLRSNGLTNFEYIETTLDYSALPGMIHDIEAVGFLTATILRAGKYNIKEIAITASKDDLAQPTYSIRAESRFKIISLVSRQSPKYVYPIVQMTRRELINALPKELLKLTWFCRRPINNKPCQRCGTCRKTLPYMPRG